MNIRFLVRAQLIANAVSDAAGVPIAQIPITPERLTAAIDAAGA